MTKLILSALVALALAGCAHGPDASYYATAHEHAERAALDTVPQYRGLAHQPPYQPGECLVLGRDDVWRQCQ